MNRAVCSPRFSSVLFSYLGSGLYGPQSLVEQVITNCSMTQIRASPRYVMFHRFFFVEGRLPRTMSQSPRD